MCGFHRLGITPSFEALSRMGYKNRRVNGNLAVCVWGGVVFMENIGFAGGFGGCFL